MNYRRARFNGFNLMEMMIAVAVLSTLVALLVPGLRSAIRRSESIKCMSNLRQIHSALLLFYSDHGFFPLGYTESPTPQPGPKLSPIRNPFYWGVRHPGIHTHWQIDLAAYLGSTNGYVQHANWLTGPSYSSQMSARDAYNTTDGTDPSAWRLPIDLRCPAYNRILGDPNYDWLWGGSARVHNDHYGYCYNHVVLNNHRSMTAAILNDVLHQTRDPRLAVTDYAGPNDSVHTLVLFCSRWGIWQFKKTWPQCDLPGISGGGASPTFDGFPFNTPRGYDTYSGVAAGVHGGRDNFMFLDGHVETLDRKVAADRRRMNKTWWRPLPRDGSFGNYSGPPSYHVAHWFNDSGSPAGSLRGTGGWDGATPPANYNWNY